MENLFFRFGQMVGEVFQKLAQWTCVLPIFAVSTPVSFFTDNRHSFSFDDSVVFSIDVAAGIRLLELLKIAYRLGKGNSSVSNSKIELYILKV